MKIFLRMAGILFFVLSCSTSPQISLSKVGLTNGNWQPSVSSQLQKILRAGAHKNLPVVFDFDGTMLARDIGEATLAQLTKDKVLSKNHAGVLNNSPAFMLDTKNINLQHAIDVTDYYESLLQVTSHQSDDDEPYSIGYAWAVQVMAGLTLDQVVLATEKAYAKGAAEHDQTSDSETKIDVTMGKTSYRRPFFYPEMVDLLGTCLDSGYEVWIISASNVWTVRWMVMNVLNQKLAQHGYTGRMIPQRVIGVNTLIQGPDKKLYKDRPLLASNKNYTKLGIKELKKFRLTSQIVYPLSGYYGKVANIQKEIGRVPYLVAGDSPNDHGMLSYATHALWLARLEKAKYQKTTMERISKDSQHKWLVQPVLYKKFPGFIKDFSDLEAKLRGNTQVQDVYQELFRGDSF